MSENIHPAQLRELIRRREHTAPTTGQCCGFTQANVIILPRDCAQDFMLFCSRNPRFLPILSVQEPGCFETAPLAPGGDIRTDCPMYIVLRNGEVEIVDDLKTLWRNDLVTFLIGCSFTFETALVRAGVPVRNLELGCNVPMYVTRHQMIPAGPFRGPQVVSMRPIPAHLVARAVLITARFPSVHGHPVQVGYPEGLGIRDLGSPDFGDPLDLAPGDIPVFWPCGMSGLAALKKSQVPFAITHAPGHMLVTDMRDEEFASC